MLPAGRLDATVSLGNKFSEIAAGLLLVKEAGGYVLDMNQKDIRTENLSLVLESGQSDCHQCRTVQKGL